MITINSLSGGKTSSYMAIHYPADYNLFSLVTIEDSQCMPSDKGLVKIVSDKLGKEFIATAEDDKTMIAVLKLEQKLGKEIIWLSGNSFDKIIKKCGILPNMMSRFCTTEMKIRPIFDWWYKNIGEKVQMGIGFRYDEKERAERINDKFKGIVGKRKTRNKWEEIEWRQSIFPLIENKIFHHNVIKWAESSGIIYPNDSNCVGCFWKQGQQLRKNWDENTNKMQWFADQEIKNKRWKKEFTYKQVKKLGLQQDFFFGAGAGCNAGYCTD